MANDVPMRIHCGDGVTRESHPIIEDSPSLKIPLYLDGAFSYFKTRALTLEEHVHHNKMEHIVKTPDAND